MKGKLYNEALAMEWGQHTLSTDVLVLTEYILEILGFCNISLCRELYWSLYNLSKKSMNEKTVFKNISVQFEEIIRASFFLIFLFSQSAWSMQIGQSKKKR